MTDKSSNPFKNEDIVKDETATESQEKETPVEEDSKVEETQSEENKKLQEAYDKLNQQYIRLAADFDNYRKRQEQERESLVKYGTENALKKCLKFWITLNVDKRHLKV